MNLQFLGAVRQVTGSMHLIKTETGKNLLLDCGMDYENYKDGRIEEETIHSIHPKDIYAILLSHAHIDHAGNIPLFYRKGFRGKIYTTQPTIELSYYLMSDSARIQLQDYKIKKRGKKYRKPTYSIEDVKQCMAHFVAVEFNKPVNLIDNCLFEFFEAGHILGAAGILLSLKKGTNQKKIFYTGDRGRMNIPLMNSPTSLPECDILISEATYGGRMHRKEHLPEEELKNHINDICINQSGKLIIPAFSVGRTQAIIYILHKLYINKIISGIPVYVDSPLAQETTRIFEHYFEWLNSETREFKSKNNSLFRFNDLFFLSDKNNEKSYESPCIVVSSSGMVEGGRIQEHVARNISDSKSRILIAGYCAEGTLGDRLLNGGENVYINGNTFPVNASVMQTDVFSSHADQEELSSFLNSFNGQTIFLVHSDIQNATSLRNNLDEGIQKKVIIPEKGNIYKLFT